MMKARKMIWWWIIVGLVLAGALQLWVLWAQKRMSFWASPQRQELAGAESMGFSEIRIRTTDNLGLVAWWRPPDEGKAVILFFGGNAGTIGDRRIFLEALAGSGYGILGVNYRGYGGSEGSPSEKGIYIDGLSAYDFLCREQAISPQRVVVYGQSIGGTVAAQIAHRRDVAGLVIESGFTSAASMAKQVVPYLPLWLLMTYRFDNIGTIPKIGCPKLIVHGRRDETVPFSHGEALYAAAKEPKRFYAIEGAMHNDILETGGVEYLNYLQEFLDSCTQGALPPDVSNEGN
jgi:pimeloyl-ACP methyl ester carboxylesterase